MPFHRRLRSLDRLLREVRLFARAMRSSRHPILAQIIPIRRCNLACAYCNEYDATSAPVPTEEMLRRVDRLAALGTTIITLSGGEPLLHPELERIVSGIRRHGVMATLITNGYLLTRERIRRLNEAGLDYLELSLDNVEPDSVSMKSLRLLEQKLGWLAEDAEFKVTVNSVLGYASARPEDALSIARRARELGFTATVGLLHDHSGQIQPLSPEQRRVYEELVRQEGSLFSFAHNELFQRNLMAGLPNEWHCRAGSRYLYVCEDGLVHWCSQQRGYPGIPLERYAQEDLDREFDTVKRCAPYCTVNCVHQTAILDGFREKPQATLAAILAPRRERDTSFQPPFSVQILSWMFMEKRRRRVFADLAVRLLRVR
jgi:MoaA/NifB/PqqE/SkfB family radical SAM enzyme